MNATELCFFSISQLAERLQRRAISPVEITQAYLDHIQTLDPQLNSYLTVTAERALQDAKAAEMQIQRGNYLGSVHGVPLAHKDLIAN
jgi:Asp-tRNA(Asn)/Glu-tRNA(Gln) amidotransferase A subunit family amidase